METQLLKMMHIQHPQPIVSMQDFLLEIQKDDYYKAILESLSKDEKIELIRFVEKLAGTLGPACKKIDSLIQDGKNLEILIDELGDALNRRSFKGNAGVEEGMWPITKSD